MMKKLTNSKALLLSLVLVMCLVLPIRAQKSDGFFRNDELYNDRNGTVEGLSIGTQGFGCGLLIMLGAGTVYAVKKRKRITK